MTSGNGFGVNEEHVAASFRFIVIVIPLYFMQTTVRHPGQNRLESPRNFVKLRRGSGKDRQGMAVKAKGLKA